MAISGRYCRSERAIVKRHAPPICHCEERSDVAISGRHCRSVRAIEKRHAPPICHCEEAGGRRGNLGKALPFGTSHRKNGTHLRFVIARSEATWQSREGTAVRNGPPLNRHAPPICHCEERSDVAISGRHPRSVLAAVKTVLAPRFVIARRPEADVAISQYSLG